VESFSDVSGERLQIEVRLPASSLPGAGARHHLKDWNDNKRRNGDRTVPQDELTPDQYRDFARKIIHCIEKQYRIVPLNSLKHPRYHLKVPVYLTLESADGLVIASFDDVEAFSHAETESEAIDLLCEEIVQLFEDLTADSNNLGPLPKKWLDYLTEIIECR
jgi:hypothetical protein